MAVGFDMGLRSLLVSHIHFIGNGGHTKVPPIDDFCLVQFPIFPCFRSST